MRVYLQLAKARISALSSLSAAAGYVLWQGQLDARGVALTLGTALMAAGSAGLNQVQERSYDRQMPRTRHRPLPSQRLTVSRALVAIVSWLVIGGILVAVAGGPLALALGLLAAVLYNGIYTPLKRRTAFAVLPGALIGAVPPAMGWVGANGPLGEPRILGLMLFLFVWQIPHFWLLVMRYAQQYEAAGFPTVVGRLGMPATTRITVVWILATGVAGLLIPLLGAVAGPWGQTLLAAAAAGLAVVAMSLLAGHSRGRRTAAFVALNSFALIVLALLVAQGVTGQF